MMKKPTWKHRGKSTRMARVKDLEHLSRLVDERRAVFVPDSKAWVWNSPRPAAFIINLTGQVLVKLFALGMYVYEPRGKK